MIVAFTVVISSIFHIQPALGRDSFLIPIGIFAPRPPANDDSSNETPTDASEPTIPSEDEKTDVEDEESHKVIFNFNEGHGQITLEHGEDINIPYEVATDITHGSYISEPHAQLGVEVSREGYDLLGWTTVVNDGDTLFDFNTAITDDTILYAFWGHFDETLTEPGDTDPTEPGDADPTEPGDTDPTDPGDTDPTEPPASGPMPDLVPPQTNFPEQSSDDSEEPLLGEDQCLIIAETPPEDSGIVMEVDDEGNVIITGDPIGEANGIIIANAPMGIRFLRIGIQDEIFIIFPEDTEQEEVEVTTPTRAWTYEFFDDVEGNLILALLPPGVILAEVLSDPLNPQPEDTNLLIQTSSEAIQDTSSEPTDITRDEEDDDNDGNSDNDSGTAQANEQNGFGFPTGLFSNSLALLGAVFLICGQRLLNKNKID